VKFAVPRDEVGRAEVREQLRAAAEALGYQFASVDAATTKIHLADKLFHAVAAQVDWDDLAYTFVTRLLEKEGLKLPPRREDLRLANVAAINDFPEPMLRTEVRQTLGQRVFRDYAMSQEFRLAMVRLCEAQLEPTTDPTLTEAVREWLRGDLRLLSAVKHALIFQKIARHNARHMLFSLAHWLRLVGKTGLVLVLDVARYLDTVRVAERPPNSGYYHSVAAALDAYEVLRQLVDGADELEGGFVCVLADPTFLNDERRGLRRYDALYLRVWDEVHDRRRENPLSALVRLA
jgi:hypothetical protein